MDYFALLLEDHKKARDLFRQLEESTDAESVESTFAKLKKELENHTELEEGLVYPKFAQYEALKSQVDESHADHDEAKELLDDLSEMQKDTQWSEKLAELKASIEEHIRKEEESILPRAAGTVSEDDLQEIKAALEKGHRALEEQAQSLL